MRARGCPPGYPPASGPRGRHVPAQRQIRRVRQATVSVFPFAFLPYPRGVGS